ncbi:MAG TPA: ABC transporter permease [Gaiellaceae bacterium]
MARRSGMVANFRADTGAKLPAAVIVVMIIVFVTMAHVAGRPITWFNGYDIMQNFGELGWITLGIALSMIAGEFDLSLPSLYYLGGAVAVLTGVGHPWLGVLAAVAVGIVSGGIQGAVVAKFRMSSVPVTLGGYIILLGIFFVVTGDKSIAYSNYDVGARLDQPIFRVFSIHSLIIVVLFVVVAAVLRYTRVGVVVRAVGGGRRASRVAGVSVDRTLIGIFIVSAAGTAFSGALLGYSTSAATPNADLSPLIFAVTAAVLGGVRLEGGRGSLLGIAIGVIALSMLQEGLVIINISDQLSEMVTGGLLAIVALISAPDLRRRGFPGTRSAAVAAATPPPP